MLGPDPGLSFFLSFSVILTYGIDAFICTPPLECRRAAAMTLRTVLLSIQALLNAAEPDDPQDAVVASQVSSFYVALEARCSFPTHDDVVRCSIKNTIRCFSKQRPTGRPPTLGVVP